MKFTAAFRQIALYFNRSASDTVLYSGIPFSEDDVGLEDIERMSERLGLECTGVSPSELRSGHFDYPLLVVFANGTAVPLVEEVAPGLARTIMDASADAAHDVAIADITDRDIAFAVSFTAIYLNQSEEAAYGKALEVERRHWLARILAPFWRSYVQVALATVFINVIALAMPLFSMNVYDRVLPNKAIPTLWVLAIGVTVAAIFDFLLKTVRAAVIDHAGKRADAKLAYMLFEKILNTSLASKPMSTGEYASRVSQYEYVREFFTSSTLSTFIDCLVVFIFVAVIYVIIGWIAILPVIALILTIAVGYYAQRKIGLRVAAAANESSQRQSLLVETIGSLETVKVLRAETALLRRWQQMITHSSKTSEEIKRISAWAQNITQVFQQMVTVSIIIAGAYEFAEGHITTGAIIAVTMLAGRAVAPLGQLAMTLARMRQAMLSLRILDMIMKQPEDVPRTTGFVNREITRGAVSFNSLVFSYPGTEYKVLNNIDFTAKPGEKIGVIGRIGSGKTTIGRLLAGLYVPESGRIVIDGVDMRQYHPAVIRSAVSFVSQNSDLFSGTVKENLLLANPVASDEELLDAARSAGVDSFVSRHPKGYDMPVGEHGNCLSGGQRQAMTIARALLQKPKIVFLDEPSGAMDLASERELINVLSQAFAKDVTLFISTHRHSMLSLVDRIIVLDRGTILADGPKDAVIEYLRTGRMPSAQAGVS